MGVPSRNCGLWALWLSSSSCLFKEGPLPSYRSCHGHGHIRFPESRGSLVFICSPSEGLGVARLLPGAKWSGRMEHEPSHFFQASAKTSADSRSFCVAGIFCTCRLKEIFSMVDCSAPFQMLPTWVPVSFKVSVSAAAHLSEGQWGVLCSEL